MIDIEWFIFKGILITYIRAFVEFYKWKNYGQVYDIYRMIKLEKIHVLTLENFDNFGTYQMIEILLVL